MNLSMMVDFPENDIPHRKNATKGTFSQAIVHVYHCPEHKKLILILGQQLGESSPSAACDLLLFLSAASFFSWLKRRF